MISRFVNLNLLKKNKFLNKPVYILKKITCNSISSISKFDYLENNIPKIIKIVKDENDQNKIVYENYNESIKVPKDLKKELKEKESTIVNKNQNLKIKIFGSINIETLGPQKNKFGKEKYNENDFNIFNESETINEEETDNQLLSEDLKENLLNYNSFFSDFCRVYVKAGDGGNGSISVLKGPMFDQGIKNLLQ